MFRPLSASLACTASWAKSSSSSCDPGTGLNCDRSSASNSVLGPSGAGSGGTNNRLLKSKTQTNNSMKSHCLANVYSIMSMNQAVLMQERNSNDTPATSSTSTVDSMSQGYSGYYSSNIDNSTIKPYDHVYDESNSDSDFNTESTTADFSYDASNNSNSNGFRNSNWNQNLSEPSLSSSAFNPSSESLSSSSFPHRLDNQASMSDTESESDSPSHSIPNEGVRNRLPGVRLSSINTNRLKDEYYSTDNMNINTDRPSVNTEVSESSDSVTLSESGEDVKNGVEDEEEEDDDAPQAFYKERRYSLKETKGQAYGALPPNTFGKIETQNSDSDVVPLRQASVRLKDLDKFADGVYVASVAANRPIEDRHFVAEFEPKPEPGGLFSKAGPATSALFAGVFDGHGGYQVAQYLAEHVHNFFQDVYQPKGKDMDEVSVSAENALHQAFIKAENEMWSWTEPVAKMGFSNVVKVGSCAVSVVVLKEKGSGKTHSVIVANVGDCRCVMGKTNKKAVPLSTIHNSNEESERKMLRQNFPKDSDIVQCQQGFRNRKTGAQMTGRNPSGDPRDWVEAEFACYIKGALQPSRTFGDFYMKYQQVSYDREMGLTFFAHDPSKSSFPFVSAEPEMRRIKVADDDSFLVLASDGLWDFLKDDEVVAIIHNHLSIPNCNLAQILLDKMLEKAAREARLTLNQLKQLPAGNVRRRLHDDCTILVIKI